MTLQDEAQDLIEELINQCRQAGLQTNTDEFRTHIEDNK
jgi:D-Tyr-tRNAtyr deacylase